MKRKQGISLIVLVITIIVIVILAVAVILSIANNNPIGNAKDAVNANEEATIKEEATLLYSDWYTKEKTGNLTGKTASEYVKENLKGDYSTELVNKLVIEDDGTIEILSDNSVAMKLKYGDYVKYIDAEGNERLASVLYESSNENGLEIVLWDNLKKVNFASGLEGYNNARVGIQKKAEEEINNIYAVGARPLGGATTDEYLYGSEKICLGDLEWVDFGIDEYVNLFNNTGIDDKNTFLNIFGNLCNEINGIPDCMNVNIYYDSIEGVYPSYFTEDDVWVGTYYNYCLKYDNGKASLEYNIGYDLFPRDSNDSFLGYSSDDYFIPVIKLRSTVEVASGDGTYANPYIMKAN